MEVTKNNKNKDMLNKKTSSSKDDKGSKEENRMDTADYDLISNKLIDKMKSICNTSPHTLLKKLELITKTLPSRS
eukprot:6430837-Ditylum_brightwellii.AAC.1